MANRIYTKTEESGFGDPLIGNDDNFDILQYIGASDTPEGSPAAFCGTNNHVIYQQQQQLINAAASELVQALQAPGPLQAHQLHKDPTPPHQQQQAMALDNVGLMMYGGGGNGGGGDHQIKGSRVGQQFGRGGQTRLPDSPPITDVSGGASSISPGSSGGCDSSPFSPDQYQYVHHQQQQPGVGVGAAGVLLMPHQQHPREEMLLVNQMGHMMGQRGGILLRGASGGNECMHSPNSEFLSPYPPSQSTPGSQHSSQISPPAISHQKGLNYLLQCQPPNAALSVAGSFASMDNLYAASADANNGNSEVEMGQQQYSHQGHGQKRRRMSSSAAPGSNESLPLGNNTASNLPNIKSEIGTTATQVGSVGSAGESPNGGSPNALIEQHQRILLQQAQQQSFEDLDENMNSQKTIKFDPYMRDSWNNLYDIGQHPLPPMPVAVVADKGFNYSSSDNCFVNQKKNHFQITINIGVDMAAVSNPASASNPLNGGHPQASPFTPRYVRVHGVLQPILDNEFYLSFCGVKSEMQTSEIRIKQSQADRKPIDHEPEGFTIDGSRSSVRQTVARLHFGETTMNNHRKNGKPNPEQKFFLLVVKLLAKTPIGPVLIQAYHSDRVIVRASNPGQFEQPDQELNWQRGQNGSLAFPGQVCIGTGDKPIGDAQLTVHGNIATTGNVTRPSDRRVKEDIADLSTTEAMSRVAQMRLVEFAYKPEIAQKWGLSEQDRHRVGVIAQELAEVLPDAVKDNGEFLTVDDTRVFYDTVAAAQELYRLTGNLECKIDQVEKISQKLARYAQKRRQLGSMASGLSDFSTFFGAKGASLADKQSCVSYSRTSLTSAGTNNNDEEPKEEKRNNNNSKRYNNKGRGEGGPSRHYRCRSYSSASAYCNRSSYYGGPDSALCNSKFTQGTIVTLVVIMAICLVTMCTLYVMDWYNRTYSPPFATLHPPHPPAGRDHPLGPGEIIEKKWALPKQQNVPPLTIFCGGGSFSSLAAAVSPFAPSCPKNCCPSKYAADAAVELFPLLMPEESNPLISGLSTLAHGVKIEILDLNVTIDGRFCINESCDSRNGYFNLYVPISGQLPTIPLLLRISVEDPTLLVDGCGSLAEFPHEVCQLGNNNNLQQLENNNEAMRTQPKPSSNKITDNIFEVTAGSFLKSAYKFRIGHSANLCQQDERQRGRMFDEFNLIFYRICAIKEKKPQQQQKGTTGEEEGTPPLLQS